MSIRKVLSPVFIWIISIYPFFLSRPSKSTPKISLDKMVPAHFSKDSISKISNDYLGGSSFLKLSKFNNSYSCGYISLNLQSHTDFIPLVYSNFQFFILSWDVMNWNMGKFKNRKPSSIRIGFKGLVMLALFILNSWPMNLYTSLQVHQPSLLATLSSINLVD